MKSGHIRLNVFAPFLLLNLLQSPCDTLRSSKPQVCSPQMGQLVV